MKAKMINEDSGNRKMIKTISDVEKERFGKDLDKEMRNVLAFWLSGHVNNILKKLINELEKGTKVDDMPDDIRETFKLISQSFKNENPNPNGTDTIPQKIKSVWKEDIGISRSLVIDYLKKAISIPPGPVTLQRLTKEYCK